MIDADLSLRHDPAQGWNYGDDLCVDGEGLPCTVHLWNVSSGMLAHTMSWQCPADSLEFG